VVLRPGRFGLLLHTLYYSDEVRAVDEFRSDTALVSTQELELAALLVQALAGPFEPAKYKDHYQENLRALLEAKIKGKAMEEPASSPALAPVVDILEALKASLARKRQPQSATAPRAQTVAAGGRKKRTRAI
jgi:DNA end-binding protein Ku